MERNDFSFVFLAQPLATINTFVVRIVELNSLIFFSEICLKLRSELDLFIVLPSLSSFNRISCWNPHSCTKES